MFAVGWEYFIVIFVIVPHDLLDILISDVVEVQQVRPTFHESLYQILLGLKYLRVKIRVFSIRAQGLFYGFLGPNSLLFLYALSDIKNVKDFVRVSL